MWSQIKSVLRNLLHKQQVEAELQDEIESYVAILAGGIIGIAGAWFVNDLLASMLVGVKVHDPISLSIALGLMTLIALIASSIPAKNASDTNVMYALHSE